MNMSYKVGDKLVLEITENEDYTGCAHTNSGVWHKSALDKLDRLDSDYINDNFGYLQDRAYDTGLNDAWNLAIKILCHLTEGCMLEVFGSNEPDEILNSFEPQEALAKLEAYEKERNEIKVGDELISISGGRKAVVTHIDIHGRLYVMWDDGTSGLHVREIFKKTGKHVDIQDILNQIRGDE